ncbi:hypothetical protein BZA77DRAFT_356219 [Pyronema omphalodes]|nr:hypothetical protein BZA77DRAFT_356219 [Pyronema omphalodes]
MSGVASKNPFDLLGNDPPEEDVPSKGPPREVVKKDTSSKKKDEKPASATPAASRGNGRGGKPRYTGNDAAFRDREAGAERNRSKPTNEDGSAPRGGAGRGGPRRQGGRTRDDRRDATGKDEHEKQVNLSWGGNSGESALKAEIEGQEAALKEAAAEGAEAAAGEEAATPVEEEDKTKTYDQYLAELAAKKAALGTLEIRRPQETSDKKWANAKAIDHDAEEVFFAGESKDKTRTRERKQKQIIEIEPKFVDPNASRGGQRGGRDGQRGGRDGQRGGQRGGAPRGGARGGRAPAPAAANVNLADSSAFPKLGA